MATFLYLSNQLVQVVEAKKSGKTVTVSNVWQEAAPEGSIINGIITDEEAFLAWINEFFFKHKISKKEVSLVVNSSQFNHRVLEFPKIKDEEIRKMIPREFSENRTGDTLFTYYDLEQDKEKKKDKNKKKRRILATAVEKSFLLSYLSFFKKAGIEISSIDSEIDSLIRLFGISPEIAGKTCLIQVLDGQEVISMLFVKGRYYYSQKNRLFQKDEILSIRRKLFQFATSEQIKEPISTIFLCGNGRGEFRGELPEDLSYKGDKVLRVERGVRKKKVEFFYPIGALLGKKQNATFFGQLRKEQREGRGQKEFFRLAKPALIVSLIGVVGVLILGNIYLAGERELKALQKEMEEMQGDGAGYEMSLKSVDVMRQKMELVEETWNHLMSYPTVQSSIDQVLQECAGDSVTVKMKSFGRDSGALTLEATTGDVRSINGFVAALEQREEFALVEYSGYTYEEAQGLYRIHVVCSLSEGAGR